MPSARPNLYHRKDAPERPRATAKEGLCRAYWRSRKEHSNEEGVPPSPATPPCSDHPVVPSCRWPPTRAPKRL
ncbi:putative strigolactone esterase D14 [Senna tora]|uniref:Putative strigolactone esterase D14 n=1 Tax=Senna tora TaxID=362788 RepID=A0A834T983_9FABA|nr:putative strigolactone esterase D14 [Senna tora]